MRLKDTTFILGDKPMRELLWCNTVPKGKRNKPAKINGIQHHEVARDARSEIYTPWDADFRERVYYQPL